MLYLEAKAISVDSNFHIAAYLLERTLDYSRNLTEMSIVERLQRDIMLLL